MNNQTPYTRFQAEDLILRDELAIDRTLLANERTLLAYLRMAISMVIAGASIMNFASTPWFYWVGVVSIPTGVFAAVVGIRRCHRMNMHLKILRDLPPASSGLSGRPGVPVAGTSPE